MIIVLFAILGSTTQDSFECLSIARLLELHEYDDVGDDHNNETSERNSVQTKESYKVDRCRIGQSTGQRL
jgi:hypothetical protein